MCMFSFVYAADVKVQINGEIVDFKDAQGNTVNAQIINDRTMVPMRKIFELLGLTVDWDGENRIVTGEKGDTKITLQIDNPIVKKEVAGKEEEITLDAAPTIVDDRTLVPLRFIAESIDKQVGWDNDNRTAIIIDYQYFLDEINKKSPNLYQFLTTKKDYAQINYSQNYSDLADIANNNNFNIKLYVSLHEDNQDNSLTFTGNSELAKDIISESWNSTIYNTQYGEESAIFKTDDFVLNQMIKKAQKGAIIKYQDLGVYGNPNTSVENFFRIWAGVEEKDLKISTFSALKNDFERLCVMFKTNTNGKMATIQYATYNQQYFDLFKLDNLITSNEFLTAFNFATKLFLKNDIQKSIVLYDFDKVTVNYSTNGTRLTITMVATNSYNEKYDITLDLNHA